MPHITIEYSRAVERQKAPSSLLSAVHQGAVNSDLFNPSDIKIRCAAYDDTWVGGEEKGNFLHVMCRILSGRNTEQKTHLVLPFMNSY